MFEWITRLLSQSNHERPHLKEARIFSKRSCTELPAIAGGSVNPLWGIAAFVDTETTGLNYHQDEIIELAIILFAFDRDAGKVIGILDQYAGLREPTCEISKGAIEVNGITRKMVQGQCLDRSRVEALIAQAEFIISHNASFDLGFVHHLFPAVQLKPWLCSMNGIDWYGKGFRSRGLQQLIGLHGIRPGKVHRGLDDAQAALSLLSMQDPSGTSYFEELLRGPEAAKLKRTILDQHVAYGDMIHHYYAARETDPTALEAALYACTMQISIALEASKAFKRHSCQSPLSGHPGFDRLTLIREQQGEYAETIRLCQMAMKQGWDGKWEARISRCENKLAKATAEVIPKKRGRLRKSAAETAETKGQYP